MASMLVKLPSHGQRGETVRPEQLTCTWDCSTDSGHRLPGVPALLSPHPREEGRQRAVASSLTLGGGHSGPSRGDDDLPVISPPAVPRTCPAGTPSLLPRGAPKDGVQASREGAALWSPAPETSPSDLASWSSQLLMVPPHAVCDQEYVGVRARQLGD